MSPVPDCGENSYRGSGRLAGKRAVITGGDSGIGRAVAIAYAREGADVLIQNFRPGTAERLGIPADRLMESVWWLDSSGTVYGGAEAANAAVSTALGTRIPLLVYRIPGMRSLQEATYRWVADHRYRFPGTTPYCESHPVAC